MRILLICAVAATLAAGCKTAQNTTTTPVGTSQPQTGPIIYLVHGTSFGHCIGYCIKEERYQELSIQTAQISRDSVNNPKKTATVPLSDGEFGNLGTLMDWNKWNALPAVIGCPDCADGGAEYIEIRTANGLKRVTFDAGSHPEGIEKLLDHLRNRKKELFQEEQ